eukprot:gnl/MRDRNA2_/MRDRNA2_16839_c0_seq2.p1 gnl/MRDRNA2_/MRDRNA2_16839_c0~~gnl/MRDRNA2_/MRDRNA2_16839_c0_seq2.p1  ORF type:complete len:388 (+),score=72.03 gnl/MRDRNA2_/MRDRNA2_16839_c0_seq2:70-1233(+)
MTIRVLIVGNGVIGLTTALELRDRGYEVVVVSSTKEQWHADSSDAVYAGLDWASGIAGGVWMPFHVEPMDRALVWGLTTLRKYHAQLNATTQTEFRYKDLIEVVPVVLPFVAGQAKPAPDWASGELLKLHRLERLTAAEVEVKLSDKKFRMPPGYGSAWLMYTTVCDTVPYLAELVKELVRKQVEFRHGVEFKNHMDVCRYAKAEKFSCVVNCAGLGSVVMPARGALCVFRRSSDNGEFRPEQSVMMQAEEGLLPGVNGKEPYSVTEEKPAYIIPRGKFIVAGGTYLENDLTRVVSEEEKARLHCVAKTFMPGLKDAQGEISEVFSIAGLRPVGVGGVRCEVKCKEDGFLWADNFGHGGAGWGMAWGCAKEIAESICKHSSSNLSKL